MSINVAYMVALGLGFVAGTLLSIAYFMHLARQTRMLCNNAFYGPRLLLGAVLRMSILLATGWFSFILLGPLSAIGYGVAFILVRTVVIQKTRKELLSCN